MIVNIKEVDQDPINPERCKLNAKWVKPYIVRHKDKSKIATFTVVAESDIVLVAKYEGCFAGTILLPRGEFERVEHKWKDVTWECVLSDQGIVHKGNKILVFGYDPDHVYLGKQYKLEFKNDKLNILEWE